MEALMKVDKVKEVCPNRRMWREVVSPTPSEKGVILCKYENLSRTKNPY